VEPRGESAHPCLGGAHGVRIDGGEDFEFLARAFHKLLINFTAGNADARGDNIFEGGFRLDNIGPSTAR
jgi:hypothetical protein